MKIQEVRRIVGNLPHMTLRQAETITQFIADQHIEAILELGFEHGVSTCYMAAALKEAEVPLPLLWGEGFRTPRRRGNKSGRDQNQFLAAPRLAGGLSRSGHVISLNS